MPNLWPNQMIVFKLDFIQVIDIEAFPVELSHSIYLMLPTSGHRGQIPSVVYAFVSSNQLSKPSVLWTRLGP